MSRFDRRRFLLAGALAPVAATAACSDAPEAPDGSPTRLEVSESDLDFLEFAAGLEVVAGAAYRKATADLTAGRLGEVPAAGSEFLQAAATQHGQGLAAINEVLEADGRVAVGEPNLEFESSIVTPALTAAKAWPEVAALSRTVETALAATYLQAIHSTLQAPAALRLAGGLQATGQKRVAVLNFLMGEYPVPDTFQKTDSALSP